MKNFEVIRICFADAQWNQYFFSTSIFLFIILFFFNVNISFHHIILFQHVSMSSISSKSTQTSSRTPNIKWSDDDLIKICQWFDFRNAIEIVTNVKYFNITNKLLVVKKLLSNIKMKDIKSKITTEKIKNKLIFMMNSYKKTKTKIDQIEWRLNDSTILIDDQKSKKKTIAIAIKKMCSWFHQFDFIFDTHFTIRSFFISEFDQSNALISKTNDIEFDHIFHQDNIQNISKIVLDDNN